MRFDGVTIGEGWGVANATGFHPSETVRGAPEGDPFSVCRIDGRQVGVFLQTTPPPERRTELAARTPDWLDAVVHATTVSDPRDAVAMLDANIARPNDVAPPLCAFAIACVAFDLGLFKVVPESYVVRFEGRAPVRVRMAFDDDTASWSGDATSEPSAAVSSPSAQHGEPAP